MRHCLNCGQYLKDRTCPTDGWPTLRVVRGTGAALGAGITIAGRYRLDDYIGAGGFAKVFGGVDMRTKQRIAVKVLSKAFNADNAEAAKRFVREAATTSTLTHGNTIRLFDYGQTQEGQLFLVMERLEGESLGAKLRLLREDGVQMETAAIVAIGSGVLQSLNEAHGRAMVHRDLKPENIFLHRIGKGRPIVKVLDFGIVRSEGSKMTQAGQPIGTPTHMSPEQAQGHAIDPRSDLYSLGVVLYECATGKLPFHEASSAWVTMLAHVTDPVPPILAVSPEREPELARVIEKSLAKKPDERWQNAGEMREALRGVQLDKTGRAVGTATGLQALSATLESSRGRRADAHEALARRHASRLNVRRPPGAPRPRHPPPPPPPPTPPPTPAQQQLHAAETATVDREFIRAQIAAEKARRKGEAGQK